MASGPLKPGFGLSGMFTRHRLAPANKLDCPHAMGLTRFHHSGHSHFVTFGCYHRPVRLLRCARSLRAGSGCLPRRFGGGSSSLLWSECGAVLGLRCLKGKPFDTLRASCGAVEIDGCAFFGGVASCSDLGRYRGMESRAGAPAPHFGGGRHCAHKHGVRAGLTKAAVPTHATRSSLHTLRVCPTWPMRSSLRGSIAQQRRHGKHKVPFDFAQGRLSTSLRSGRDDKTCVTSLSGCCGQE